MLTRSRVATLPVTNLAHVPDDNSTLACAQCGKLFSRTFASGSLGTESNTRIYAREILWLDKCVIQRTSGHVPNLEPIVGRQGSKLTGDVLVGTAIAKGAETRRISHVGSSKAHTNECSAPESLVHGGRRGGGVVSGKCPTAQLHTDRLRPSAKSAGGVFS